MKDRTLAPLVILLAIAGPGCAYGGAGGRTDRGGGTIIDGTVHTGDPAVVYLTNDGSFSCTGSLIAPRVVLTARHCIEEESGARIDAGRLAVGTGPEADTGTHYANVIQVETTTGDMFAGNDIAVLVLDAAGSLTPYPIARAAPGVGMEIVGIGYGQIEGSSSGSSPAGVKYRGASTVGLLDAMELTTAGPLSCYGDSGGPGFVGGLVAGVVSRGTADTCEGGQTVYTRVDAHLALIDRVIASVGTDPGMPGTPPPGDPGTPPGTPDPGCDPADPSCCDPSDPACGGDPGCDPSDPACTGDSGCDPSDPACTGGCDPADPYCDPGCDPSDPACSGGCDPADPYCDPGCDPSDPACSGGGGDLDGDGCPDEWDWDPYTPGEYDCE